MAESAKDFESMIAGIISCGMSVAQIAHETGLARQTVNRLKIGEYSAPSYETIRRIKALELRVVAVTDAGPR
jgi:DNA-binding phage protein